MGRRKRASSLQSEVIVSRCKKLLWENCTKPAQIEKQSRIFSDCKQATLAISRVIPNASRGSKHFFRDRSVKTQRTHHVFRQQAFAKLPQLPGLPSRSSNRDASFDASKA